MKNNKLRKSLGIFIALLFIGTTFAGASVTKTKDKNIEPCPIITHVPMTAYVFENNPEHPLLSLFRPIKGATLILYDKNGEEYRSGTSHGFLGSFCFGSGMESEHKWEWWTITVDAEGYQPYEDSWQVGTGWKIIKLTPKSV